MTDSAELRARLEAGVQELEADIARLRAAIAALDGDTRGTAGRTRQRRAGRAPGAQPVVVPAGKLSHLLKRSDGMTTAELSRQTGGAPDQILLMLKQLEEAGQAHRSGERRTTRWHSGGRASAAQRSARQSRAAPPAPDRESPATRPVAARESQTTRPESEAQIATALDSVVAS